MTQSSWNQNSYLNIKLGEQLSLKAIIFLTILVKLYLVEMCPIFASSASNCLTRYKQILSGCSLGFKNVLNFICLPMKFHNRGHTNLHSYIITVSITGSSSDSIKTFRSIVFKIGNGSTGGGGVATFFEIVSLSHTGPRYSSRSYGFSSEMFFISNDFFDFVVELSSELSSSILS